IPSNEADPTAYLVRVMLAGLNIDAEERAVIFVDDLDFQPGFDNNVIDADRLRAIVEEAVSGNTEAREDRVFKLDERTYQ
ncbi:hypothetical protein ABTE34_21595, partial [Acinetobacter baumannii]